MSFGRPSVHERQDLCSRALDAQLLFGRQDLISRVQLLPCQLPG